MKKTLLLLMLAFLSVSVSVYAGTLEAGKYYTWSIPEPNIPVGAIIVDVEVTLHNLTTADTESGLGQVRVYLVDAPPTGWIDNIGTMEIGSFLGALSASGVDQTINLKNVVLLDSWTHRVFKQPFDFACTPETGTEPDIFRMNAAILEYIDYAGNSTTSGLLLRAVGGKAVLSGITVKMLIRGYNGSYYRDEQTFNVEVPLDTTYIEKWAEQERLKLMQQHYQDIQNLEARIEDKMING